MNVLLDVLRSSSVWASVLDGTTSVALVAFGGFLFLKAGVLNLGLEGLMLIGCFTAAAGSDVSSSSAGGLGLALAVGAILGASFCFAVSRYHANALLLGIAFNFVGYGVTTVLEQALFRSTGGIQSSNLAPLPRFHIPLLGGIPWVGNVISGQTVLTYVAWVIAIMMTWWLHHTRGGLTVKVAGIRPDVVRQQGRSLVRVQSLAGLVGGALIGAGGAQLSLGEVTQFQAGMTDGRGFVALAIILLISRRVWSIIPISVAFALLDAVALALQGAGFPPELSHLLPYLALPVVYGIRMLVIWIVPKTGTSVSSPVAMTRQEDSLLPGR